MKIEKIIKEHKENKSKYEKWNRICGRVGIKCGEVSKQKRKYLNQLQELEYISGCGFNLHIGTTLDCGIYVDSRYSVEVNENLIGYKLKRLKKQENLFSKKLSIASNKKDKYDKKRIDNLFNYQSQLVILPDDETRFEQMEGYPVKVVNLDTPQKGVAIPENEDRDTFENRCWGESEFGSSQTEMLLEHKVVGLINTTKTYHTGHDELEYYGLPVERDYSMKLRKKK